ncbi:hypothetical protein [Nonomuraea sp. NPDC052265]|uniref:hypothetical protein n=1 Tax=Nonomuraea sp. NPDC052265 TaxID=3364374 RepID=UPI0037C80939
MHLAGQPAPRAARLTAQYRPDGMMVGAGGGGGDADQVEFGLSPGCGVGVHRLHQLLEHAVQCPGA